MSSRVVHAATAALRPAPLDPAQVMSGDPVVAVLPIVEDGSVEVGIWEHSAGVSSDVEADEVFVVLSGRATVSIAGGPTLDVSAGDVCILKAGDETIWTVHETLRKIYFTPC